MDYSSTGGMKSPFSPRIRQSLSGRRPIGLSSAKKSQSKYGHTQQEISGEIIYKTSHTTFETYGMPLPVMVTEALTFASGDVSVRMSPCGWCWAVTGRRVLAWPREMAGPSSGPSAARELTLPQTDLAHKADLVVIFYEDNEQAMPSCVGVSPEGVVRYWASIGQEGSYSEISCELAGQECDRLVMRTDESGATVGSLVLATTTCTLVRITTSREGRPTVSCQTLRPPSGWLGGIGRRVSLLFFGSMPAHADTKLVGVVVLPATGEDSELVCLVGGGPTLQLWGAAGLHEHHLRRALVDAFARAHLAPHGEPSTMEIMALDVHPAGERALVLLVVMVAAFSQSRPSDMRYALAHISIEEPESPVVTRLCGAAARAPDAPRLLPLPRALLYTPALLALLPAPSMPNEKTEYIDLSAEDDRVLGAADDAIFTRKHGLLRVRTASAALHAQQSLSGSPSGSPSPSDMYDGNLTFYEIDPHELSGITTDACGKLKLAFIMHVRRDPAAARALADLFPARPPTDSGSPSSPASPTLDVDAPLDRTVMAVATELLDDVPAGDPRWRIRSGSSRVALGSSGALQAAAQLRDKRRAFTLFVDFLRAAGLHRRLALVSREGGAGVERTAAALGGLWARLAGARALQRLHAAGAPLLDAAMQHVAANIELESWDAEEPEVVEALRAGALSAADVCVRRVTRVRRVCRALCALPAPADARAAAAHAAHALNALTTILSEMQKSRIQWAAWGEGEGGGEDSPRGAPEPDLPALVKYHAHVVTRIAHKCPDAGLRAQVLESASALADALLSDAAPHRAPHHAPHRAPHNALRRDLLQPYVSEGHTDRAAALAEKFKDLELLVTLCVRAGRMPALHAYIDKYEHEGIAETAFGVLASGGGVWRALLVRELGGRRGGRLARWLHAAPARRPLRALHALARQPHRDAADALLDMADEEQESVDRMVTMASLSKLCLAASDEHEAEAARAAWRRADALLSLGAHHRALPPAAAPPLHAPRAPHELLQLYLDCDSKSLTEYDFKKALDLTEFIEDPDTRDDLRLKIWAASISCGDWQACREQDPQLCVQNKMFYRLLELLNVMGSDVESLLPPLEQLLAVPSLQHIVRDPRTHYLLKYTYSCLTDDDHEHEPDQE